MMNCECGGILLVIAVEEAPKQEKLVYNRACDVECQTCGMVCHSQPYDSRSRINDVKRTKPI